MKSPKTYIKIKKDNIVEQTFNRYLNTSDLDFFCITNNAQYKVKKNSSINGTYEKNSTKKGFIKKRLLITNAL